MANPPFTGSIDKGDINENLQLSTTKTGLLFVENIYRLLKKGGTACIIVPPWVILDKLLKAEVGKDFFNHESHEKNENVLKDIKGGIIGELRERIS